MDISIIIPVYNVEKYLSRCLDSIFSQRFSGTFEVIAVDDGSTDSSLEILNQYAQNENRLQVIVHSENKKLSVARRTGMDASTGDYIMHMDSDDWILPDTLEILYTKCKETDADVVVFDFLRADSTGNQISKINIAKEVLIKDKLLVQKYFFDACVLKIVKRKLIQNMIYGTIGLNSVEDLIYSIEILLRADTILLLNKVLYAYFVNQSSITQTVNLKALLDNQIVIYGELQKILSANSYETDFKRGLFSQREKVICFLLLKNHLSEKKLKVPTENLVSALRLFYSPNDKIINRIALSARSKYFCMAQYFLSTGFIKSSSMLLNKVLFHGGNKVLYKKSN